MFSSRKTYEVCFTLDVCVDKESYEIKVYHLKIVVFGLEKILDMIQKDKKMMKLLGYKSTY